MKIKDCILCKAVDKNTECHILMDCPKLKLQRTATTLQYWCDNKKLLDKDALKLYLDPKCKSQEEQTNLLQERTRILMYLMKEWENEADIVYPGKFKKYCKCDKINDQNRPMVQCDGPCQNWFHYDCAELPKDFYTECDWICRGCYENPIASESYCICGAEYEPALEIIKCKGKCHKVFHPECINVNTQGINYDTWTCEDCS